MLTPNVEASQDVLVEAGFDTREKIIDLVRQVKRDVAEEYTQMFSDNCSHRISPVKSQW